MRCEISDRLWRVCLCACLLFATPAASQSTTPEAFVIVLNEFRTTTDLGETIDVPEPNYFEEVALLNALSTADPDVGVDAEAITIAAHELAATQRTSVATDLAEWVGRWTTIAGAEPKLFQNLPRQSIFPWRRRETRTCDGAECLVGISGNDAFGFQVSVRTATVSDNGHAAARGRGATPTPTLPVLPTLVRGYVSRDIGQLATQHARLQALASAATAGAFEAELQRLMPSAYSMSRFRGASGGLAFVMCKQQFDPNSEWQQPCANRIPSYAPPDVRDWRVFIFTIGIEDIGMGEGVGVPAALLDGGNPDLLGNSLVQAPVSTLTKRVYVYHLQQGAGSPARIRVISQPTPDIINFLRGGGVIS